jgi:hypothetical protein
MKTAKPDFARSRLVEAPTGLGGHTADGRSIAKAVCLSAGPRGAGDFCYGAVSPGVAGKASAVSSGRCHP